MASMAAPSGEPVSRPLRADARRNRERIVKAARAVFAEQGRDAQMDDVARRAKVGVGTVYRHFPTKEALIQALAADKFERMAAAAEEALATQGGWDGLAGMIQRSAEQMASDRALYEALSSHDAGAPAIAAARARLAALVERLIARAHEEGSVRPDLTVEDMPMLMCGIGAAVQMSAGDEARWRRHVAIVLDGLRA